MQHCLMTLLKIPQMQLFAEIFQTATDICLKSSQSMSVSFKYRYWYLYVLHIVR